MKGVSRVCIGIAGILLSIDAFSAGCPRDLLVERTQPFVGYWVAGLLNGRELSSLQEDLAEVLDQCSKLPRDTLVLENVTLLGCAKASLTLLDLKIIVGDLAGATRQLELGMSPSGIRKREAEHLFCSAGNSLQLATGFNRVELIQLLVGRYKVSPDVQDKRGFTPLFFTNGEREDIDKTVELLLQLGASLEMRSNAGYTPLTNAVAEGDVASIEVLMKHGAKVVTMPDGASPSAYVRDRSNAKEIIQALGE